MPDPIRVVLADDHPVVLAGVAALIRGEPDIEIVGEATDGVTALGLVAATVPDVAVLDVSMPGPAGHDLAQQINARCAGVRILVLTVHEDPAYVRRLLGAGARGYLLKRSAPEELLRAIRSVAAGGLYLDPQIAAHALVETPRPGLDAGPDMVGLSRREAAVLRFVAQGFSNKEIGGRLSVSVKTVETYRARGAEKLGLRTRAQIIRYGAAHGWLDDLGGP